ncbi:hypothetical protein COEREDRAFT_80710 [Coemansia reversa NRRL 1564]|uniref:Uncharacterized protein n=1 Tax=Coemansia reversa (strain ATCC 12441 / NRRL 1564) TaxID=763665 RepID=A0A2G5BD84_COERN|nr:hypothetical protein COEREDRAFT_80710 [Coemansia reversa NRRL 1564]|eukprot:PIA16976.1 hypothetical protein COEREDRAFT_80710 [Coemansia reversa NRRL 1564]
MERTPSRAKATNILRPASRAQDPSFARNNAPSPTGAGMQPQPQPLRVPAGNARVMTSFASGTHAGFSGVHSPVSGGLRRAPSAAQIINHPQQQQQHAGGGNRQRISSFHDGMPVGDFSAMPRTVSRSGSRADLKGVAGGQPQFPTTQHQQQQQPPRSFSRAGRPNPQPGGMWPGQMGQMGMNTLFGGGFGTMGVGPGPMSADNSGQKWSTNPHYYPMHPQQQQQPHPHPQQPLPMGGPGSRPGSSLHQNHPPRPFTSNDFRTSGADPENPVLVNVNRGGARVIGPIRGRSTTPEGPSFLNPIPQSPSSVLGGVLPGAPDPSMARENIRSALSNHSIDSGRSHSNSALQPTEESMEAAEARVSRKIQDLEISNKSLMAVNTQLESRLKTQREQINELKKQLQLKVPFAADVSMDGEVSDEALRSALKEDKVFERLISNLEHLIQDAKSALEYRSTIAAGKVISAAELNEADSQLTIGSEPEQQTRQDVSAARKGGSGKEPTEDVTAAVSIDGGSGDLEPEKEVDGPHGDSHIVSEEVANDKTGDKGAGPEDQSADSAKQQEARELVARLMVLALSSPGPTTPEKPSSRVSKRTGHVVTSASRPQSALKSGLRTPIKSASTRISSFGVASTSTPVRSIAVSPTPSSKASGDSGKDLAPSTSEKEQILEICRKLQNIL